MSTTWKSEDGARAVLARYRALLAYVQVPVDLLTVATRHGDTFVIACGPVNAPALMLHHGGAINSLMWMGDVVQWSRHFRCYAVDMIGEPGLSAPVRLPLDSDAHTL